MAAAVEQHVDFARLVARDDHRLQPDVRGLERVGAGQFAGVRHPDPAVLENPVHLASNRAGSV
jgi:hypothetical protein